MNILKKSSLFITATIILFSFTSCKNNSDKKEPADTVLLKKDKPIAKNDTTPRPAPIINISDTVVTAYSIIYVKDSAINSVRLSHKLVKIYDTTLANFARNNKLTFLGPPQAIYKSQKAPFFFEAGIPVDKKPSKLPKGVLFKKVPQSRAVIAHFYGPYEESIQAYQILKDWLKDMGKRPSAAPYEIYVNETVDENGKAIDPYKVQTDIVAPYR
jgi:effector-binding domain-containing protein